MQIETEKLFLSLSSFLLLCLSTYLYIYLSISSSISQSARVFSIFLRYATATTWSIHLSLCLSFCKCLRNLDCPAWSFKEKSQSFHLSHSNAMLVQVHLHSSLMSLYKYRAPEPAAEQHTENGLQLPCLWRISYCWAL